MDRSLQIGLIATAFEVLAFVWYNRNITKQTAGPNAATWTLWVFLTVLNAGSYAEMTKDPAQFAFPIAAAICTAITFVIAYLTGSFRPLKFWDKVVLVVGVAAALVWWWFRSATYANLLVQAALVISFVPTYRDVWREPQTEKAFPWYLWSVAYGLLFVAVISAEHWTWHALVYPAGCCLWHVAVAMLTHRHVFHLMYFAVKFTKPDPT